MEIVESLPFDCCRNCSECVLKVKEQNIFNGNTERIELIMNVSCSNINRCKKRGADNGYQIADGISHQEGQ